CRINLNIRAATLAHVGQYLAVARKCFPSIFRSAHPYFRAAIPFFLVPLINPRDIDSPLSIYRDGLKRMACRLSLAVRVDCDGRGKILAAISGTREADVAFPFRA